MRVALRSLLLLVLLASSRCSIIDDLPDVQDDDAADDNDAGEWEAADPAYHHFSGDFHESLFSDEERSVALTDLFARLDANGNGQLDRDELRAGLVAQTASYLAEVAASRTDEARRVVHEHDSDADGQLSADEFEAAQDLYLQLDGVLPRRDLFAFADAGADGAEVADGYLSADELVVLLFPEASSRAPALSQQAAAYVLAQLGGGTAAPRAADGPRSADAPPADDAPRAGIEQQALYAWMGNARRAAAGGAEEDAMDGHAWHGLEDDDFHAADADGDGRLDKDELPLYLLPDVPRPYTGGDDELDEELAQLMGATEGGSEVFELPLVLNGASMAFSEAFYRLMIDAEDERQAKEDADAGVPEDAERDEGRAELEVDAAAPTKPEL